MKSNRKTLFLTIPALIFLCAGCKKEAELGPTVKAERGPLTISVVASGTIQSKDTTIVRSQAQGRNTVIWVIDEGRSVTNGQLLVELDSSELTEKFNAQQITVGNAQAALTQSQEKLAIEKIDKESNISEAELALMLAKLEFEKFKEGEYPQQLQDAETKITLAREELKRAQEQVEWTRKLADKGYLTRSELEADELSVKQKKISLDASETSLNVLTNYTARQQFTKLESAVDQANYKLDRVTRQANANVAQAQIDVDAKVQELERLTKRLDDLETQINNCRITSPTNGLVIFASTMRASRRRWGGDPLQAGSTVVEREELIYIPSSGGMLAEFTVPESTIPKLSTGLPARVKVDSTPDTVFLGHLKKIGILPDGNSSWLNPDMKLYNCVVALAPAEGLRSGSNCEIELLIEKHENVISIPIQCVLRIGEENVVHIVRNGRIERRPVTLGFDNARLIHIISGLEEGDEVLLNPPLEAAAKEK